MIEGFIYYTLMLMSTVSALVNLDALAPSISNSFAQTLSDHLQGLAFSSDHSSA